MTERRTSEVPPLAHRPHAVSVAVAAHLERLIATGELAAGARLPSERELAATMSVSRSTLREALHELEAKRLVLRIQGRGTVVLAPSAGVDRLVALGSEATEQHYAAELRSIIEPSIAELAAHRATPADVLRLGEVLGKSHEHLLQGESLRLDMEFHLQLARAAQNPLLAGVLGLSTEWTGEFRKLSHASRRARRVSVAGHRSVFEAVAAHDGEAARQAMDAHLADVAELIAHAGPRGAR